MKMRGNIMVPFFCVRPAGSMVFPPYRLNSGIYSNGLRNSKVVLVQNSWNCSLYLFVCLLFL